MTSLFIAVLFLQISSPAGNPSDMFGVLLRGSGTADIRSGLSTFRADTLTAFPACLYQDEMFDLTTTAAVEYSTDSSDISIRPVSAGAFVRWPGSPWIRAGVFQGLREPYLAGITSPVVEWEDMDVTGETGVSAEAGGILGFDGFWHQYHDTLSWYGVKSPWLGFGMASWSRFETDSSQVETVGGFIDLPKVQPWFLFSGRDDEWSAEVEVVGWKLMDNDAIAVEVVPGVIWSEDSSLVSLGGYLGSQTSAVAGFLKSLADTDDFSSATISGGFSMLSLSGVQWDASAALIELEQFDCSVSGIYRSSPAGCGGIFTLEDDSASITAVALYSPVRGVSSRLSVFSDLDGDSPDPGCSFAVTGAGERGSAVLQLIWQEDITELSLGVSAWID